MDHMDKHDRPYKCLIKGCEKLQGFTYTGGLPRHEREVHKMHDSTKSSFFCSFTDCKRSSGAPFSRKANLAEHHRRVHLRTPTVNSRQASKSPNNSGTEDYNGKESSFKRKPKRNSDSVLPDRVTEDLQATVKRLRHEGREKDARLRQLESTIAALQQSHQ
ncbi:hypothetical protein N0V95_010069 [Ascochyta clinopodiicola]|nr:hypothetical protein N0V95_010069 [Ascochyta clinopodiicola]